MKEYRLVAWPQLHGPFDRIAYRRMLSDMSHRHMTLPQLCESGSIRREAVRRFLDMLESRQLLSQRESSQPASLFGSLKPLDGWLRRVIASIRAQR
jgi:hypothetical protein